MNIMKSAEPIFKLAKDCSNWATEPLKDAYSLSRYGIKSVKPGTEIINSGKEPMGIVDSLKEAHKTGDAYDYGKLAKTAGITYGAAKVTGHLFGSNNNNDNMLY